MMNPRLSRKCFSSALLLLGLLVLPIVARAQVVTDEGFAERIKGATIYAEIPMVGVLGEDAPAEGVKRAIEAAAKNEHITHAVFMVDSYGGTILDREIVGEYEGKKLEVTAVVRAALTSAAFPVFFADKIFMVDEAIIGGLPLHLYVPQGSEEVTAKQVGIFSAMAASAADTHGHNPDIVRSMINEKEALYFWREDGKPKLSNTKPGNTQSLKDFRRVMPALPGSTMTLDQEMAEEFGFASPIDDFDAFIVGEYLGHKNWHPANNFGRVANEIGNIVAELQPLRESIAEYEKELPEIREADNIPERIIKEFREYKRSLESAVEALDMINDSLEKIYEVHPERHVYFLADDSRTIVEDPRQWAEDAREARNWFGRANSGLNQLESGFKRIGGDSAAFYDLIKRMQIVNEHLMGIERHGNAAYWAEHAKPDLPDDIYG